MIESKTKLIIGIFVAILLLAGSFTVFYYYQRVNTTLKTGAQKIIESKPNWYKQVQEGKWSKEVEAADALSRDNKYGEAVKILESVKSQMTDPGERSIVDLKIAYNTFFGIDTQQGAQRYATIAKIDEYPVISRAYAMLLVADQFSGIQDKNLLKPFFDEKEFASKDKSELIAALYQRVYDTHRFGLAAGVLAVPYLRNASHNGVISDADYAVVNQYVIDIDRNLIELETTDAFKRFIPVTLLVKARLFALIEDVGRPVSQPAEEVYLLAIARARTLQILSTEQFSILFYADYLAKKGQKDKVIELLSKSLSNSALDKRMVRGFLQSKDSVKIRLPNLYKLQQDDPKVNAVYKQMTS